SVGLSGASSADAARRGRAASGGIGPTSGGSGRGVSLSGVPWTFSSWRGPSRPRRRRRASALGPRSEHQSFRFTAGSHGRLSTHLAFGFHPRFPRFRSHAALKRGTLWSPLLRIRWDFCGNLYICRQKV
ncbi:hypothetical protein M758_6G187900, partial [Ceratodon purpureus]